MYTVQISGIKFYDTQMSLHIATQNTDVVLAQEFLKHSSNKSHKRGIIYHVKHQKR